MPAGCRPPDPKNDASEQSRIMALINTSVVELKKPFDGDNLAEAAESGDLEPTASKNIILGKSQSQNITDIT